MKVSDYIVKFLIEKGITDAFGYPGGSISYLVDSFSKYKGNIRAHVTYHEQSAAFAACAYASMRGKPGVAYATGGPGTTNLLTGMGHAYYDSVPVIFLTGNVNTYEAKKDFPIRQRAFQESDNISIVAPLTKYAVYVDSPEKIRFCLEKAYYYAMEGRRGPVVVDLPMDVQRGEVDEKILEGFSPDTISFSGEREKYTRQVTQALQQANRPCLILGNGVKNPETQKLAKRIVERLGLPYVTSMIAFDILGSHPQNFGFIGAYGARTANFILAKCDLVISIGSRLDIRQVGVKRENFAPDAQIFRVDIDAGELEYKVHNDEHSFCMTAEDALQALEGISITKDYSGWTALCREIKNKLQGYDDRRPNEYVKVLSELIPEGVPITTDVGQNQVWVPQSFLLKPGQQFLFSGGMGSMGHALPAAMGAYYGSGGEVTYCFCGDGGLQMNIQELQYIVREDIPVKIIVFNNNALGMIRHFQEMYFNSRFFQTKPEGGYSAPDFVKIANAYGIRGVSVDNPDELLQYKDMLQDRKAALIEIRFNENTYIFPKLEFGKPNQDQEPLLDRQLYDELMKL